MISGFFSDEDALFFEIELITADGLYLSVDSMFDTGFSGYLAINNQDLDALGWTYIEQQAMLTAQGEAEFKLYLGQVQIDGQDLSVPVHVGEELTEVLLGRQWLQTKQLLVNKQSGILTLG